MTTGVGQTLRGAGHEGQSRRVLQRRVLAGFILLHLALVVIVPSTLLAMITGRARVTEETVR